LKASGAVVLLLLCVLLLLPQATGPTGQPQTHRSQPLPFRFGFGQDCLHELYPIAMGYRDVFRPYQLSQGFVHPKRQHLFGD
jgi:hypothetical protein